MAQNAAKKCSLLIPHEIEVSSARLQESGMDRRKFPPEGEASDVMELLKAASEQLAVGEMLHSPAFNLFNVMSAVEIGDPRLDAGDIFLESPELIFYRRRLQ